MEEALTRKERLERGKGCRNPLERAGLLKKKRRSRGSRKSERKKGRGNKGKIRGPLFAKGATETLPVSFHSLKRRAKVRARGKGED